MSRETGTGANQEIEEAAGNVRTEGMRERLGLKRGRIYVLGQR